MLRPSVIVTLAPPALVGVVSLVLAMTGPGRVTVGEHHLALVVGGVSILSATALLLRRHLQLEARTARLIADVDRLRAGEIHHFAAVSADDPLSAVALAVNELGDDLRARRIEQDTERALDQAMVHETPNGLVVTDARGRIRRFNRSFRKMMPMNGDPVGKPPIDTIPVPELQEVIEETLRTRAPSERTTSLEHGDFVVRAVPLADGEGAMGVILDITSVRQAERARREFVANVSHELRTPITAVVGYAESLLEDKAELPEWTHPMLGAIDRNARRLGALIEDVLHLSRIEARKGDFSLGPEALRPLCREVWARFVPIAQQRGVALTLEDGPEVEAWINLDAFEHALNNLVDNALKYTPTGGHVRILLERQRDTALVSVSDNGIGIDPAHHDRIFERFYRVDSGRSRDVGGTGLGLALVKHLCLAMHAEVVFNSAPGRGSTFTLRLPTREPVAT